MCHNGLDLDLGVGFRPRIYLCLLVSTLNLNSVSVRGWTQKVLKLAHFLRIWGYQMMSTQHALLETWEKYQKWYERVLDW